MRALRDVSDRLAENADDVTMTCALRQRSHDVAGALIPVSQRVTTTVVPTNYS